LLLQKELRWLGHVIRMPDHNRLLRLLLYSEPTPGFGVTNHREAALL